MYFRAKPCVMESARLLRNSMTKRRFLTSLLMSTFCNRLVYNPMRLPSVSSPRGAGLGSSLRSELQWRIVWIGEGSRSVSQEFSLLCKIFFETLLLPSPLDIKNTLSFRMKRSEMRNRVPLLRDELTEGNLPAITHLFL